MECFFFLLLFCLFVFFCVFFLCVFVVLSFGCFFPSTPFSAERAKGLFIFSLVVSKRRVEVFWGKRCIEVARATKSVECFFLVTGFL